MKASQNRHANPRSICSGIERAYTSECRGATMLEFALVIPALLLLILAFIDLVRVIAVQGILIYAAEDALQNFLVTPNTDVDIRSADPNSADYKRYFLARQRIIGEAVKFPLQTSMFSDSSTPGAVQLVPFTYNDPTPVGGLPLPPFSADIAMLRPAERVKVGDDTSTTYLENSSYPFPGDGVSDPPMERLLALKPVVVEIHARVRLFTPLIGSITARGVAQGFRQPIVRSPLPDEDPAIMASVATPWPSPPPAATPYPYAEPSPTPSPGGCVADASAFRNCKTFFSSSLPDLSAPGPGQCPCLTNSIQGS